MSDTLFVKNTIQRVGFTVIDGVKVLQHTCSIESDNPEKMRVVTTKLNEEMYKNNRNACRADIAEFEDGSYLMQEEILANVTAPTPEASE